MYKRTVVRGIVINYQVHANTCFWRKIEIFLSSVNLRWVWNHYYDEKIAIRRGSLYVELNIEAYSRNHWCNVKAISITHTHTYIYIYIQHHISVFCSVSLVYVRMTTSCGSWAMHLSVDCTLPGANQLCSGSHCSTSNFTCWGGGAGKTFVWNEICLKTLNSVFSFVTTVAAVLEIQLWKSYFRSGE